MASHEHRLALLLAVLVVLATGVFLLVAEARSGPAAARGTPVERALRNVRAHPEATHSGPGDAFRVHDVVVDPDGTEHVHMDRLYRGLPVLGGDLIVHSSRDGSFLGASQTLRRRPTVPVRPLVSAASAVAVAGGHGSARLIVDALGSPRLAWDVVIRGFGTRPNVLVDARSGRILGRFDGIDHATGYGLYAGRVALQTSQVGATYRLSDPTRGDATVLDMQYGRRGGSVFSASRDVWGDGTTKNRQTVAVDVQFAAGATWDYFLNVLGRKGQADDGVGPVTRVHFGRNYDNAFWDDACNCATFGDGDGTIGPLAALDVVGHELTHGVTAHAADFVQAGESGGLNEATSDIFGTMIEFANATPSRPADYRIGERLFPRGKRALRYMWRPSLDFSSPDCWSSTVAALDPHDAAGPANHFFYLLAEGSRPAGLPASPTCDGAALRGIGRDAAARIWYRALTVYLTAAADYRGARAATQQAAADLFGAGGVEASAVAAAWHAVGVPDPVAPAVAR